MSPLDELFAVLLALYLYECTWSVPSVATIFVARLGGSVRAVRAQLLAGAERSLIIAPPLCPFVAQWTTLPFHFALSPSGIVVYEGAPIGRARPQSRAARFLPFAPPPSFSVRGRTVCVDRWRVAAADTASGAERLAERLAALAALDPAERARALAAWTAARLDVAAARARLAQFAAATTSLRVAVAALFAWLAILSPVAAYRYGLARAGVWLLAGLVLQLAMVLVAFLRAARRADGGRDPRRVGQALLMAIYPCGAVRALDLLAREACEEFEPVTIALAAGDARARESIAAAAWREARCPLRFAARAPAVAEAEAWAHDVWRTNLERTFSACGIDPERSFAAAPLRDGAAAFCPRCRALYGAALTSCADCEGVALESFEPK